MWEWLAQPLDAQRLHDLDTLISWHARLMVLAWVVLAPLAVLGARYLKILPGQDWPRVADSQLWWRLHWGTQLAVFLLSLGGLALVLWWTGQFRLASAHACLGTGVLLLMLFQLGSGLLRGSKGGPSERNRGGSMRGDHYDMTLRRRLFEWLHKSVGYLTLLLAACAVFAGLWQVNAPRWMAVVIVLWYGVLLVLNVSLQRAGWAADTYEAIWGPDPRHPGNRLPSRGWGMRRQVQDPPRHERTSVDSRRT